MGDPRETGNTEKQQQRPHPGDRDSKLLQLKEELTWPGMKGEREAHSRLSEQHEQWPGDEKTHPFQKTECGIIRLEPCLSWRWWEGESESWKEKSDLGEGCTPLQRWRGTSPGE